MAEPWNMPGKRKNTPKLLPDGDEWLDYRQAGVLLGITGEAVRLLCDAGKIAKYEFSEKSHRILRSEVERYKAECYRPATKRKSKSEVAARPAA
jgi:hypothetical protein